MCARSFNACSLLFHGLFVVFFHHMWVFPWPVPSGTSTVQRISTSRGCSWGDRLREALSVILLYFHHYLRCLSCS